MIPKNMIYAAIAAIAVIIVVAYVLVGSASATVVQKGDNVSVYYTGTYTNGTVFDSNAGRQPLQFTVGSGAMIEGFDSGVVGMGLNQTKTITLTPDQAYGQINPQLIVVVPIRKFGNQTVTVGMPIAETTANGQQLHGFVKSLNATNVTVDFNPRLAGYTLVFKITVVGIQRKQ